MSYPGVTMIRIGLGEGVRVLRDDELTGLERDLVQFVDDRDQVMIGGKTGDPAADDPSTGGTWGAERQVRAELLAELLTGTRPVKRAWSILLSGVRITGTLDLAAATITRQLHLVECHVDEPIMLSDARAQSVTLALCHLNGLVAQRARFDGSLNLRQVRTDGATIDLLGARIDGQLLLSGARLRNPRGTVLRANGVTATQGIFCNTDVLDGDEPRQFTAEGVVDVSTVTCGWDLDFSGSRLSAPRDYALMAENASLKGNLRLNNAEFDGGISLLDTKIDGSLLIPGTRITYFGWWALYAPRLVVGQDVTSRGGTLVVKGGTDLTDARVDGTMDLNGARLNRRDGLALTARNLLVGRSLFCANGFHSTGTVDLTGTRVGGSVDVGGARFTNPGGTALNANRLTVPGELHCDKSWFRGQVLMRNTQTATVDFSGARLLNPGGSALSADTLRVERCLFGKDSSRCAARWC